MRAISRRAHPSTRGACGSRDETAAGGTAYGSSTRKGERSMLRTIFMIGLFAIAGLFVLRLAFGLFAFGFGLLGWLFFFAIKVAIVGAIIYLIIRVFSPET